MARFVGYAEVLTPEHDQVKMYEAGMSKGAPGLLLADVLAHSGGRYETRVPLSDRFREKVRAVAAMTSDTRLLEAADRSEVTVSLEHLRGLDPATTLIVCGARLEYSAEDGARLGRQELPKDPRKVLRLGP